MFMQTDGPIIAVNLKYKTISFFHFVKAVRRKVSSFSTKKSRYYFMFLWTDRLAFKSIYKKRSILSFLFKQYDCDGKIKVLS